MEKLREAKFVILVLYFISILEPLTLRRIRQTLYVEPTGFVEPISVDSDIILMDSIRGILKDKAGVVMQELLLEDWEIKGAIEKIKENLDQIIDDSLIKERIYNLAEEGIRQRKEKEPLSQRDEAVFHAWYEEIVYTVLSREFARILQIGIDDLLPNLKSEKAEFFVKLKEEIDNNFLGIHYKWKYGTIPDKFAKAIKLVTEDSDLFGISFFSLFGIRRVVKRDILQIWVRPIIASLPKSFPEKEGSYRCRVTINRDGKIISAEYILKLLISSEERLSAIKENLLKLKELKIPHHVAQAGAWSENVVWTEEEPERTHFLAITQKSFLYYYIKPLTTIRQELKEKELIVLETMIIEDFLGIWKATKEIINGEEKGLVISVWPGRVSIYPIKEGWEFQLIGIEYSVFWSLEKLIRELQNQGYDPQAIQKAKDNILG